ncbi:hypothetical protein P3339_15305 [Microbulbifer sp. MLAF003]|uniref:hypothetical protein n=1 Tax=Microbulbifer sp. MLAF003 TaxID=3032582 RepID=UPI0024AD3A5A|nr:hypothetical protein [Microbulbifer sp. MLAF003]WHI49829.1 hypothetical protein P3339_15305 [Microbulbifer sp. MLAF003]
MKRTIMQLIQATAIISLFVCSPFGQIPLLIFKIAGLVKLWIYNGKLTTTRL